MGDAFILYSSVLVFSFVSSVIQGITGFGDGIMLQVIWYTASVIAPDIFNATPLGDSPVRAVTLLMYARMVFLCPLLAYMSLRGGIFSWQMTLAMAIPSTITSLIGIFIFKGATSEELKLILGISGLVFAGLYVVIIAAKYLIRRRKLQQLQTNQMDGSATEVTILPEVEAVEADLNAGQNANFGDGDANASAERPEEAGQGNDNAASPTFVSLTSGSPFRRREAEPRPITEPTAGVGVPELTPTQVSPTETITYTRVRVNRNLDDNGKIKFSTKVGAFFSSAVSGIMGSLTGVGGPPQILFVLLFDIPAYIIRVNFAMQMIPCATLRFIYACATDIFTKDMAPVFVATIVGGFAGIIAGVMLGKVLGPKSYSVFVLVLLLLSSLEMITKSVTVLVTFTLLCFLTTAAAAFYEHKHTAAKIEAQRKLEAELEAQRAAVPERVKGNQGNEKEALPRAILGKPVGRKGEKAQGADVIPAAPSPTMSPSNVSGRIAPLTVASPSPPPLPAMGGKELGRQRTTSSSILSDNATVSTPASSRTSSRVRRAELHRPPSLWKEKESSPKSPGKSSDHPSSAGPPLATNSRQHSTHTVNVPAAQEVEKLRTADSKTTSAGGHRGMCTEDVNKWIATQEGDLLHVVP